MKRYDVRLTPEAEADIVSIYTSVLRVSGSPAAARKYIDRLTNFLSSFDLFPKRGSLRDDVRKGLRIIGFERTLTIAFVVELNDVVILRIGQHGQQLSLSDEFDRSS